MQLFLALAQLHFLAVKLLSSAVALNLSKLRELTTCRVLYFVKVVIVLLNFPLLFLELCLLCLGLVELVNQDIIATCVRAGNNTNQSRSNDCSLHRGSRTSKELRRRNLLLISRLHHAIVDNLLIQVMDMDVIVLIVDFYLIFGRIDTIIKLLGRILRHV